MAIRDPAGFRHPPPATPTVRWFGAAWQGSEVILSLVKTHCWRSGAELGLWEGRTMEFVLSRAPSLRMIGVDLWAPQPGNEGPEDYARWDHGAHERSARRRLERFGDRALILKERTIAAAAGVEDASLDFVFIDADHGEAAVRADIEAWAPKLRRSGWLIGHDINWPGVSAAVEALAPGFGVGPDSTWFRPVAGW